MKTVYKDHSRDQQITVFTDRWSYVEVQQNGLSGSWTSPERSLQTGGPYVEVQQNGLSGSWTSPERSLQTGGPYVEVQQNGLSGSWTSPERSLQTGGLSMQVISESGLTVHLPPSYCKYSTENNTDSKYL